MTNDALAQAAIAGQTPDRSGSGTVARKVRQFVLHAGLRALPWLIVAARLRMNTTTRKAPFSPKPGKVAIRLEFRRTGKSAGHVTLKMGDDVMGSVAIERTWPTHGTTAGLNVGEDAGSPVSDGYSRPFRLKAANLRVVVELEGAVGGNPGAAYQAVLREQ